MSELRFNAITGDWVIIASERAKRPADFTCRRERPVLPAFAPGCPFCPGNEALSVPETLRLNDEKGQWLVRSVVNKFAAVHPETVTNGDQECYQRHIGGYGRHEVIIESPAHHLTTALQPPAQVRLILEAYRRRFLAHYEDERIAHVILYKNHGQGAGTSLEHPHSQIVGLPVVPSQVKGRLTTGKEFRSADGNCIYCHTLEEEIRDGRRLVARNRSFAAFIPYAALSPFHIWIIPLTHEAVFGKVSDQELDDLGSILRDVLGRMYHGLANPDFNYVIRSAAPRGTCDQGFHWYLSIVARLNLAAGFELGTGMFINPALPEASAAFLRQVVLPTDSNPSTTST